MTPRVFRCTCFAQDLSPELHKLSLRFIKCVFVGYSKTQKRYQCYNPSTRKYLMSADVILFEFVLYFSTQVPVTIYETVPYMRLFLLHCLRHCLHLLIQLLCQCHQQKLQIHLHQSQFGISDTSTLIAQRFLPPSQFRLTPLRLTVLLLHHQPRIILRHDIDYFETFSPVARINSIRILFSIVVNLP